ncbi:MAG: hypothetical protein R3348_03755 [Xanthomonadales bacterium]|nr:hypothetical protein [Xanthomonadales bacterium]
MILRRLAESIRRQDWSVVAIEILIVVVGIFLGLQVDDWNQYRRDRADEAKFVAELHDELMLAAELSARLRNRRTEYHEAMISANNVLFRHENRDYLTDAECDAVGASNYYNINVAGFSSLNELTATGRMAIIRDADLRRALIELQQTREALLYYIQLQSVQDAFAHLPNLFPKLVSTQAYKEPGDGEIGANYECDLSGMQSKQAFLNQWASNIDGFDAYMRDAFRPWLRAFDRVHALVDGALGVKH